MALDSSGSSKSAFGRSAQVRACAVCGLISVRISLRNELKGCAARCGKFPRQAHPMAAVIVDTHAALPPSQDPT